MAIINTGAVERTITGVNTSDLFLDESNSNVTNTGAVERQIEDSHDANFVHPLGDELVLNGQFHTDSDWTLQPAFTISDGKAIYDNSANQSCFQNFDFEIGKKYKVNFEISDFTTDYRFDVYTGVSFIQNAIITSETSFSILFDGDGGNILRFRGLARGTGFSLDNISVKEVLVNRESDITNTGVTIRDIEGINESEEMFPNNTESNITNLSEGSEGGGGSFPIDEEEAGNDIVNGRLNENADGYILSQPNWSWVDGAIQYDGTGESYFGVQKTRVGAVGMSSVNQILRFEVLAGEFFMNSTAVDSNMNMTNGTFGVGIHEINPMQMLNFGGTEPTIYIRSSVTGSRIDNFFLQPA